MPPARVTAPMIDGADLVLAMTEDQRDRVAALAAGAAELSVGASRGCKGPSQTNRRVCSNLPSRLDV